ncbi:hypothetical protein [Streptacidiphilus sp. EB129]|jgi:hypothetical protein|uniref:hypothetical protein n=1 Tax=Streptacidiphilus sp. EB129 TaxID=3156262 RepID=UPI0035164774
MRNAHTGHRRAGGSRGAVLPGLALGLLLLLSVAGCAGADRATSGAGAAPSSLRVSFLPAPGSGPTGPAASGTRTGGTRRDVPRPTPAPHSAAPRTQSTSGGDPGGSFLPVGACAGHGGEGADGRFEQVDCASSAALGRVIRRQPAGSGIDSCPADTDFALDLSTVWQSAGGGSSTGPAGIACLRNLRPPHPSDPGGGGGIDVLPGDCMGPASDGVVRETACDGAGGQRPSYRIVALADRQQDCPASARIFISVHNPGFPAQTACAVHVGR